jgi:hypothetical protein
MSMSGKIEFCWVSLTLHKYVFFKPYILAQKNSVLVKEMKNILMGNIFIIKSSANLADELNSIVL